MKNFSIICSAFLAFSMSADLLAQTRGPRYNPPGGGGSRPTPSAPSRPSSPAPSRPSSPSPGPRYSPPSRPSTPAPSRPTPSRPSTPSPGPRYSPPSTPSTPSTGPRYNPPTPGTIPRGPRYNPPTPNGPRGPRYNPPSVNHTPVPVNHTTVIYHAPRDYYSTVNTYVYVRWVQYPVAYWYTDGYWNISGYPYYVYRGYQYRYNPVEMCQYELVDAQGYTTVQTYPVQACTSGYDQCAVARDTMNRSVGLDRYFCAEAVDKDQEVPASDYHASPVSMSDAKKAEIKAYLEGMSYKELFRDGYKYGQGNCSIEKVGGFRGRGNAHDCKFQVNVSDKAYPSVDGSICSDDESAAAVDCNVGNEKENAGCIFKQAVESGYCH